ncbi:MAG TPA: hypothetical protein VF179_11565 [Thermoanaerobaculia bacterium]|nr:hypothetical protein [Thermoanaerobaculia bacterium]
MKRELLLGGLLVLLAHTAQAADFFVDSDDYKDGEEIVNVFLKEDDYRLMVEDIERNGEGFDWGWVKTAGAEAPAAEPAGKKSLLKRMKRGGGGNPAEPKELGFSLSSYKTVSVPKVENFSGLIPAGTQEKVQESFILAMKEAGLEVVEQGGDLELKVAIVDVKRDSTFVYFANVDPFIELELRLRDLKTSENLMLLRNQAHSNTPEDAALNYASSLLKFLR